MKYNNSCIYFLVLSVNLRYFLSLGKKKKGWVKTMMFSNLIRHVKYYQLEKEVTRNPLEKIDFLNNVQE